MPVTRREFLKGCVICGAMITPPARVCKKHFPWQKCPPSVTSARGVNPAKLAPKNVFSWPDDPQIQARKASIREAWNARPAPLRQDGLWPYLLVRALPGDHGARPITPGTSPDILIAEGFPAPLPTTLRKICSLGSHQWTVFVRVWNLGQLPALAVALRVYGAWSTDLTHEYQGHRLIGGTYLNLPDKTRRDCVQVVQLPAAWNPREGAPGTTQSWALFAVVSAVTDPTRAMPPTADDATGDRHVGSLFLDTTKWSERDEGDLTTEDTADRIHYQIAHGTMSAESVTFRVVIGPNASGLRRDLWFADSMGGVWWSVQAEGKGNSVEKAIPTDQVGKQISTLMFEKSAPPPPRTVLRLHDLDCLKGGDQVTFSWNAD
jgi:hypothetical protein